MVITHSIFGLFRKTFCDRCNKKVDYRPYYLCPRCFALDPCAVRLLDLKNTFRPDSVLLCALCGSEVAPSTAKHICPSCISFHLDRTHISFGEYSTMGHKDSDPSGCILRVRHCFSCGGILVIREHNNRREFIYYRRGTKTPSPYPYQCSKDDLSITHQGIRNCHHSWIIVADLSQERNFQEEANARMLYRTSTIPRMMDMDEETFTRSDGWHHNWCYLCGCYARTRPDSPPMPYGDTRLG